MNVHEEIRQYLKDDADDFDTKPDYIHISERIDYETEEFKNIEINGNWESDKIKPADKHTILETKSAPFYDILYNKIQNLRSNIMLSEGTIKSVTIRENIILDENNHGYVDKYPFYTKKDGKYDSMSYVYTERKPTERVTSHIKEYVQSELTELEPDISKEQIVEIELAYDDFAECELISINGYVITENPHKYYSNVDSVEEYITTLSKRDTYDYDELKNKENYRIHYRIDDSQSDEKPEEYAQDLEPLMMKEMKSIVSVKGEFMFEAESIVITDYTNYSDYEPKENGYLISDNSEYISFYVRQPINKLV